MLRLLRLLRLAFWRAFVHDAFATAKASAYSSILTFFPVLLIVGSGLANWRKGAPYLREISYALGSILPAGSNTALSYLKGAAQHPVGWLTTTSLITLWTASGVMISWMEGFRRCYELPKTWGLVKERSIAFLLVVFALVPMTFATLLVAVGSKFETRLLPYLDPDFSVYVLLLWGGMRWGIATLTSIAVIALIYHNAVPRTQPWHSVIPGAILATVLWFSGTVGFRSYLQHFGNFATIYGSLGVAMALLVWMYLISLVVLVGAEFNALLYPRAMLGKELTAINHRTP
ncbi:MAG TPA: YihY/virulence factor BrkB family protein [Candidatus Sulfotelmatobacter sp.]|jgi:membrane protein|nr:YihY/virulence factor BrkB family protein [Candidatus Sulfotelmatobacter sp.]